MLNADDLAANQAEVDGRWVVSRPVRSCFWRRLKDAWLVLLGRVDAVRFWRQ